MTDYITAARRTLIRIGKVLPFVLCFIVLISWLENFYAITTNNVIECGEYIVYNTPISFAIANRFEIDVLVLVVTTITSVAIEVCIYNLMAVAYLWFCILQRYLLWEYGEFSDEIYYAIITVNILASGYLVWRGINVLRKQ